MSRERPISFDEVLRSELKLLAGKREGTPTPPPDAPTCAQVRAMNLAGLAFSGGGIRSAAFNLGFIQGLANHKALHLFDYLSTVSGGGYIGGWLSALLRRVNRQPTDEAAVRKIQQQLATPPDANAKDGSSGFPAPESLPVRFVRRFSNYLTPRLGLSGDTLALLSTMLRNVVVMQLLLLTLLLTVFALLTLLAGMDWLVPATPPPGFATRFASLYLLVGVNLGEPGRWLMAPAQILLLLALGLALWSQTTEKDRLGGRMPNVWVFLALLSALAAGVMIALGISLASNALAPMSGGYWVWLPAIGYCLVWVRMPIGDGRRLPRALLGMAAGAATFGLILNYGMAVFSQWLLVAPYGHAVAFAPSVAVILYSFVITVHLAIAGTAVSEQQREWWSRAGGQGIAISLAWTLAFAFLLYLPPLLSYSVAWSVASGSVWTALIWVGTQLARSGKTDGESGNVWREVVARLAPWLFIMGLLGLVAWAYVACLPDMNMAGATLAEAIGNYQARMKVLELTPLALKIAAVSGGLFLFLMVFVDLNLFSAHSFYRNRLARTFLGASRDPRHPNPYTGFDPEDDMKLAELAGQRPIHLINANLNLSGGKELAWQTRRGTSFVFTPDHCGYNARTSVGDDIGGYRPTDTYGGGLTLATAIAVSGAAASPNMGYHTATAVAALLTSFNLRLALWCPNPERDQWRCHEPRFWSAGPLFAELLGETDSDNAWINLSDGGHFENLGLYELVRRRVGLIVVTDAAEDGGYHFDDLAMLVRKLSVDFGVELDIQAKEFDAIRPQGEKDGPRFSERAWAVGRLIYPEPDCPDGYLIYVKSALSRDAPVDIRQYRDAHPAFPHESTADQWFDEDQFEAYRHLGQCIANSVCAAWLGVDGGEPATQRVAAITARLQAALPAVDQPCG